MSFPSHYHGSHRTGADRNHRHRLCDDSDDDGQAMMSWKYFANLMDHSGYWTLDRQERLLAGLNLQSQCP